MAGVFVGYGLIYLLYASAVSWSREARPADQPGRPVASLASERCDLGGVNPGGRLSVRFDVVNEGEARLILRRIDGQCDCGSRSEPVIVVKPHERRTIEAEVDAERISGTVSFELAYRTNDPQRPVLRVPYSVRTE